MPTETIVRSRNVSFRDIHIAAVTANTSAAYTADAPTKFARAIDGKVTDKFSSEKIYSDDGVEDVNVSYEGTDVELEVNSLAPQDRVKIFGNLYEKGYLTRNKDDKPPEVAMGYRSKKLNGKYDFVWLYCGRFDQGVEDDYHTTEGSTTTQTAKLNASFYARELDGDYHISVDESNLLETNTSAKAAIADWFSAVQEKPEASAS